MRKFALATAITVIATTGALATDLYVPPSEQPMFPGDTRDSSFYIGVHKGYGWGLADHLPGPNFPGPAGGNDIDMTGWLAGIQAGVIIFGDGVAFGFEKDVEWTNISGSCSAPDCSAATDPHDASINYEGSARARLGFLLGEDGNVMPYATGGFAWANVTRSSVVDGETAFVFGWTAGGGIEVFTDSNVSFFVEGRYTQYMPREFDTGGTPPNTQFSKTTIRGGINLHLN
jgi:outer membrane immunogenic protein